VASEPSSGDDAAPAAGPGAVVDERYVIKREIARGGMGVVFEATHTTLRSAMALKMLTPASREWSAGQPRLLREARVLASCSHPRIVRVHDAGVCEIHGAFVALEMLEGRSLDSYLVARQRLDARTVARIGEQVCDAVAHVHSRGLLHRDIKPANLVVARDESGVSDGLKLIDFGVATISAELQSQEPKLTRVGTVLGTPEYLAPELMLGRATASAASDVYSIGVLLFEALTGELPYTGDASALALAHAMNKPRGKPPPIPGEVPPALWAAIQRALAREPSSRTDSAESLGRICREALGGADAPLDLLLAASPSGGKRQFQRAPYSAPARVWMRAGQVDGRTEDVSEGGVLVVVSAECVEGEKVRVRFPLPTSGLVLEVEGVARWIKTQRAQRAMGIAFDRLGQDALRDIRAYAEIMTRRATARS